MRWSRNARPCGRATEMAHCVLPDGTALNYRVDGIGGRAPWIVFGNSLLTDMSIWEDQTAALRGQWNILRYDQRGHGNSGIPLEPAEISTLGRDLLAVLDAAGVNHCTYVGLSMGVPTGLAAFEQASFRFARFVLVDGQARSAATALAFWDERISFARENGMDALADQTVIRWFRPGRLTSARADRLRAMIAATPLEGFVACAEALREYDQTAVLTRLNIPVHLIAGADDGAMPETMMAMRDEIPGAVFTTVVDAGHVPNFERPSEFNVLLEKVLVAAVNED